MKTQIIVNPHANSGTAKKRIPHIQSAFDAAGLAYDMTVTTRPEEATTAAYTASNDSSDMIVVAGGDGTISEVVNGMMRATKERITKPLGIIPMGTGNDFSEMQGISRNIKTLVDTFQKRKTRQVDVGRVMVSAADIEYVNYYFDNNCALAMEPMIAYENQRNKRFKGTAGYVYSLIRYLRRMKVWEMEISWNDGEWHKIEQSTYLFSVCNGPRTGSTFMMHPGASIEDGWFDVVTIPKVPFRTVLAILPRLLNGSHLKHKAVSSFRANEIIVRSRPGTPVHADGELITDAAESIHYTLLPGKLTLISNK